jgi:hypothetical protein
MTVGRFRVIMQLSGVTSSSGDDTQSKVISDDGIICRNIYIESVNCFISYAKMFSKNGT